MVLSLSLVTWERSLHKPCQLVSAVSHYWFPLPGVNTHWCCHRRMTTRSDQGSWGTTGRQSSTGLRWEAHRPPPHRAGGYWGSSTGCDCPWHSWVEDQDLVGTRQWTTLLCNEKYYTALSKNRVILLVKRLSHDVQWTVLTLSRSCGIRVSSIRCDYPWHSWVKHWSLVGTTQWIALPCNKYIMKHLRFSYRPISANNFTFPWEGSRNWPKVYTKVTFKKCPIFLWMQLGKVLWVCFLNHSKI